MIDHICINVVISASAVLYKELYCLDHCTCMTIIYIYIYIYIYTDKDGNHAKTENVER